MFSSRPCIVAAFCECFLVAYQYGGVSECKLCGGDNCFQATNKRCLNRCRYCGMQFTRQHVEETCLHREEEVVVDHRWLVNKIEEDLVKEKMPVIDISAEVARVKTAMLEKKAQAWREAAVAEVKTVWSKVVEDSNFGAFHDINPYGDELTKKKVLEKSARKKRERKRKDQYGAGGNFSQRRFVDKVKNVLKTDLPREEAVTADVFDVDTEVEGEQEGESGGVSGGTGPAGVVQVGGQDISVAEVEITTTVENNSVGTELTGSESIVGTGFKDSSDADKPPPGVS